MLFMQISVLRQTNLPSHVVQFCRYLRENGFEIGPNEESDVLLSFSQAFPFSSEEQKNLYKAILVKSRKQYLLFDDLYDRYWLELARAEDSKTKDSEEKIDEPQKSTQQKTSLQVLKQWLYAGRIDEEKDIATYSAFEALGQKDFSSFLESEQKELLEIIRIIAKKLANRYSRRYKRTRSTLHIDLKNTIRKSMNYGGDIDQILFREKLKKKVNLILICDVSKSMELYSQFLIEFMYNFQQVVHKLYTFAFSTQLVSLTKTLQDADFSKVLNDLSRQVPHWSGGTRIGESLHQFRSMYANKLLNKDAIVIILSDGWDTGDIDLLERTMKYIRKKSDRIIWLNPLAGNPNYSPTTKGMEICMPYIDVFASAHNIDSLKEVVKQLRTKKFRLKFG